MRYEVKADSLCSRYGWHRNDVVNIAQIPLMQDDVDLYSKRPKPVLSVQL